MHITICRFFVSRNATDVTTQGVQTQTRWRLGSTQASFFHVDTKISDVLLSPWGQHAQTALVAQYLFKPYAGYRNDNAFKSRALVTLSMEL